MPRPSNYWDVGASMPYKCLSPNNYTFFYPLKCIFVAKVITFSLIENKYSLGSVMRLKFIALQQKPLCYSLREALSSNLIKTRANQLNHTNHIGQNILLLRHFHNNLQGSRKDKLSASLRAKELSLVSQSENTYRTEPQNTGM